MLRTLIRFAREPFFVLDLVACGKVIYSRSGKISYAGAYRSRAIDFSLPLLFEPMRPVLQLSDIRALDGC
jgi:hypothetical protein